MDYVYIKNNKKTCYTSFKD